MISWRLGIPFGNALKYVSIISIHDSETGLLNNIWYGTAYFQGPS